MQLSKEQQQKLLDHLNTNTSLSGIASDGCPACGEQDFHVQDRLCYMPGLSPEGEVSLEKGFPQAVVLCSSCSYSLTFNVAAIDEIDFG